MTHPAFGLTPNYGPTDPGAIGPGQLWVDSTAPTAPVLKIRNAADDGWLVIGGGGGSAPRVVLSYTPVTADQTGLDNSLRTLTGLAATRTTVAGRRYAITVEAAFSSNTGEDDGRLVVLMDGAPIGECALQLAGTSGRKVTFTATAIITPAAGSHSFTAQYQRTSGNGGHAMNASDAQRAFMLIEDIGT
jgi:hypothetical protein